ncbi:hypothetical protein MPLA_890008 [Mesorhizobium sp. ORS 3359]|nr:hypothetical protein MPLA_890008 [Mesorhizobium sp. ORS 3359]
MHDPSDAFGDPNALESCEAWPAFLRVASKGVYAGGGSIAEGGQGRKINGGRPRRCLPGLQTMLVPAFANPTEATMKDIRRIGEGRRIGDFPGRAQRPVGISAIWRGSPGSA